MRIEIEYYRDVWTDDNVTRRAVHQGREGEIVYLGKLVDHYDFAAASYAVVKYAGAVVSRFHRNAEDRTWRLEAA